MKLLVDEDLASRELLRRLRDLPGLEVIEPNHGATDLDVWGRAQAEQAAILTGNVADFLRLANAQLDHYGLLLVYRSNDRAKDLKAHDIARGVPRVHDMHGDTLRSIVLAINDFVGH